MANLTTILNWFKTGLKPTQSQFAQSFSSFRHKEDKVPVAEVEGIDNLLSSKADAEAFQNHIEDEELHGGATGKYTTTIADGILTTSPVGNIPVGTDIATLKEREFSSILDQAFVSTILAFISSNRSLTVNNMDTATKEAGTSYTDALVDIIFSPGQIKNGDGSTAGNLTGNLNRVVVKAPDNSTVIDDNAPGSNSVQKSIPAYSLTAGSNVYTFEVYNNAGTTTYTDNKGGTNTVASIETAKANTTMLSITKSITAYVPQYRGQLDAQEPTDYEYTTLSTLTKTISSSATQNYAATVNNKHVAFLSTKSNATLKDNGTSFALTVGDFNSTTAFFLKKTVVVKLADNTTTNMYLYVTRQTVNASINFGIS
ncbi:hypothetical protein [Wenyingzhuangia aestuarii]|uniref:hypothetical protein n=1 Tax=Wenyingzhuangia aestuarii TaxID=1647582 RepID=UPI001439A955|nr:hypothetical protein [Wenyingzhuangia aestuarii]NJB83606.1 hypothetical protein [Wenyingzhuangia aestuarii]